jgi:hypothetical protein
MVEMVNGWELVVKGSGSSDSAYLYIGMQGAECLTTRGFAPDANQMVMVPGGHC